MRYEDLDSRIPEVGGLRENMPVIGYCKLVLTKHPKFLDERLVFVTGRMSTLSMEITTDQNIKALDGAPILAYYLLNTPQERQGRPDYIYISQLEGCVWLEAPRE